MKKFCSLFLMFVFLFFMTATAFAMPDYGMETEKNNDYIENQDDILLTEGNYFYSAPKAGDFSIESFAGTVSITDETPFIEFDNQMVRIPSFVFYKLVDVNGNVRFYQADVFENPNQISGFAYIGIYIDDGPSYSLHVHYTVDVESKLYNVLVPLTEEQFLFFTYNSSELCLGADAISCRLKSSGRVYAHGMFSEQTAAYSYDGGAPVIVSSIAPCDLNTGVTNSYDSYTDSDGIIRNYTSDYFGKCYLEDGWTITDDPIVSIVPKELCFIPGEHIYVGKEYGFFIRVVVDTLDPNDYAVDILVFDIIHTTPNFSVNETGSSRVEPLFQYTYRAANEGSFASQNIDPQLSRVVFPHVHYDYAEYFLNDVGFKFTLDNPTALNPEDSGYVASEDNGAFMIQTRVNAKGVGLKKKEGSYAADTALFALGFVPHIGTGLSVYSYAHDVYNGFGNGNYFYSRSETVNNNEVNINTLKTNSTDQIAAYGNLIKSQSVKLVSDEESPRLIHIGGGYVEAKYVIARKTGSTYNKIRVITSISVAIVEDNTYILAGKEQGELINYGRGTGTYETGTYRRLNNVSLNGGISVTVPSGSQTNVIKIVPRVSGTYKLFTSSSNGDPDFRITNATTHTAAILATNDIDGANNRNATLTLDLLAGNIYYIEAFRYGTPYAYTLRIGYNPTATQTLALGTSYPVVTSDDSYQMLKFIPATSEYYEISTSKMSGDPQVFLFTANGVLLNSDDDSGGNLNSWLKNYLIAGTTYYVAVQGYNGNSAVFDVTVICS